MAAKKDPRRPRSNWRAGYVERTMRDCWSSFRKSRDHPVRRDALVRLRRLIDQWLAEPESLHDLERGPSPAARSQRERWSAPSPVDAEFPFDRGGEARDAFFYYAGGTCSELMSGEQVERDVGCVYGHAAYFVTLAEKRYATPSETASHFSSDQAFRVHVRRSSPGPTYEPDSFLVLVDPTGCFDGRTRAAYASRSFEKARARADELAARFQVRLVVARVVRSIDTH
jgi:hypothetical protein